jgi:hypothetical protein
MPSTYTTNTGIEKIATGEQSGTWGNTTNTNLDLIDQSTNGIVEITVSSAATSGSPNSLPITNGALSNGRNVYIEFKDGGDLGGTVFYQLDPNDAEKVVHVRNNLTNQALILFQGTYNSSNDVEIPNGKDMVVKFDGAGSGATVEQVDKNLNPTTVTITGALTGTTATLVGANTLTLRNDTSTDADEPKLIFDNDTFSGANHANITTGNGGLLMKIESPSTSTFQNRHQILMNGGAGDDIQFNLSTDNGSNYVNYFKIDGGNATFNETGADKDFRVESDGNANMFVVDAGNNRVGLGTNAPDSFAHFQNADSTMEHRIETTATNGTAQTKYKNDAQQYSVGVNNVDQFFLYDVTGAKHRLEVNSTEMVINDDSADTDFRVESDNQANMLFINAAEDHVNIGTGTDHGGRFNIEVGDNTDVAVFACSDTDANTGPVVVLKRTVTGADDDLLGRIRFDGKDDAGNNTTYARLDTQIKDASNGSESSKFTLKHLKGGSEITAIDSADAEFVINQDSADLDFRVEGDTNANMIFADAGDSDKVYVGKNSSDFGTVGIKLRSDGALELTRSGGQPMFINRLASDGNLIEFYQASNLEGSISVSGSTVSYNGFSGRHESSGIPTNTPVGTVVSTIDELDVYPNTTTDTEGNTVTHKKAGQTRADHAKVEISNSSGDTCVYGVVSEFDNDGKLIVTSVGIGSILVTGACNKGDLLESNGDGTAKVQSDDIIRSKTIGKVTIGNSDTGVKLVSCVLYCG